MNGMPWIKLHTSHLDDPRLAVLDAETQLCYYKLLMLGGRLDAGGAFVLNGKKLTDEEIAWQLRDDVRKVSRALKKLKGAGVLLVNGHGWEINGWMDQQGPSHAEKRNAWSERQARHRSGISSHAVVTRDSTDGHAVVTRDKASGHAPRARVKSQEQETRGGKVESTLNSQTAGKTKKPPAFSKGEPKGFKALRNVEKKINGN